MKIGICSSYQEVANLKEIPFDYLEEHVQRFLVPELEQESFEEHWHKARRLPLPIETANCLLPATLPLVATATRQVDTPRLERYMKTALRRAEQIGIRLFVFGSGEARTCPPGHSRADAVQQLGEHLARWSGWAREHGVDIALEPLRFEETNLLNTVAESGVLVEQVAVSGAKLLADTYHMACNGEAPTDILPWSTLLAHVHVAEKRDRAAPGRHGEDLRPYFRALHQAGYDQRISIECNWQNFSGEVALAVSTIREQWNASGEG